ncbi:hypothetical protein Calab_3027 [Caldithrix abyssi DSM 13497]|uniref:Uncharacterized protein n=1 Tax=Caldithrix abyssi DSM 13497 TaxID=880073 RepID=H1XT66_CALAY|nr:hypothetical protein Calab_3027 [Caldithrix abyssi DSM 13497]
MIILKRCEWFGVMDVGATHSVVGDAINWGGG